MSKRGYFPQVLHQDYLAFIGMGYGLWHSEMLISCNLSYFSNNFMTKYFRNYVGQGSMNSNLTIFFFKPIISKIQTGCYNMLKSLSTSLFLDYTEYLMLLLPEGERIAKLQVFSRGSHSSIYATPISNFI